MRKTILEEMYSTCEGCRPVCCGDAPLVLEVEKEYVEETFGDIVVDKKDYKIGNVPKAKSGCCIAFDEENQCCGVYLGNRPIICEMHPFLPIRTETGNRVLVSKSCPYIFEKVQALSEEDRKRLKFEVIQMYVNHPRKDAIWDLHKYTKDWPEVHLL